MLPSGPVIAAAPESAAVSDERLIALDILRGLALFGMIVVHFHQNMRVEVQGLADLLGWFVYVFVEQKAWGTFAFLFGVGFAVLLRRIEARGAAIVPVFLRRLSALAVLGIAIEVAFGFHILREYAMWGLALLLMRRCPTRVLLASALVAASIRPVVAELTALGVWPFAGSAPPGAGLALRQAALAAAQQDSYRVLLQARWALFQGTLPHTWRAFLPDTNLALFLLGMIALRLGVFDEPRRHVKLIVGAMGFGAVAWATSWVILPCVPTPGTPGADWPVAYGFGVLHDQWLCLTYIGAIILLLSYRPEWTERLALCGQAGRMALTNYVLQCAVLDLLASGYGFGLRLHPVAGLAASLTLFTTLAAGSRFWLARHHYGPFEWAWRVVTYARPQPLRRFARCPPASG